ncbi:MAG: hypothetical protein ABEJ61_07030 [Haloferacaceae archaeon]
MEDVGRLRKLLPWAGRATADATGGTYTCRGCGRSFDLQHHVCPECGGFSVERRRGAAE